MPASRRSLQNKPAAPLNLPKSRALPGFFIDAPAPAELLRRLTRLSFQFFQTHHERLSQRLRSIVAQS